MKIIVIVDTDSDTAEGFKEYAAEQLNGVGIEVEAALDIEDVVLNDFK
jgi:hypothetical protein